MWTRKLSIGLIALLGIIALTLADTRATAQTESVLYSFQANGLDGNTPYAGLTWDAAGNLYGTTFGGGKYIGGTVFELSPQSGGWTETVLHTFATGQNPSGRLIVDAAGNLYGATTNGGSFGKGIVFELLPQSGGGWTYKRLHAFGNVKDGQYPKGGLALDGSGNLYGATGAGGANGVGTLFELMPSVGGVWTERILHHFINNGQGGYEPTGDLVFDGSGNLYGTTSLGGTNPGTFGNGDGTVFKLTAGLGGGWTYATIHEFGNGSDGTKPFAGLIIDAAGNLYGTTNIGGTHNIGTAYELMPASGGGWIQRILHNFNNNGTDGNNPLGVLLQDSAGNLYGTTANGGASNLGTVFKLTPAATGPWPETILHAFDYSTFADGFRPYASLIFDASGNLYGTTSQGGPNGGGTVFEITP